MALKLIKRGPETHKLTPPAQTGWQWAGALNGTNFPLRDHTGWALVTVTATNCAGLRLHGFRDGSNDYTEATAGNGLLTACAVLPVTGAGPAARVLNPTEKTEVIMHVVPIPPPLLNSWFARLVGWLPWR